MHIPSHPPPSPPSAAHFRPGNTFLTQLPLHPSCPLRHFTDNYLPLLQTPASPAPPGPHYPPLELPADMATPCFAAAPQLPWQTAPLSRTTPVCPFRAPRMVMERAPSARDPRLTLSSSENIDAIHDRLGIDKLWEINDLPPARPAKSMLPNAPNSASLSDTTSDDVTVVGDANPAARASMPWDTTTCAAGISLLGRRMEFVRKRGLVMKKSYEECRRITSLFSKTFYMGTTLFSEKKRKAIWAIYTWCRRTDDLVDGPRANDKGGELRLVLADWERRLEDIFQGRGRDALDLALVDTIANYPELSISPFQDMIKGMQMDLEQSTFDTFDDLYLYCYRVAGTVGLMTLPIMGTMEPGRQGVKEATKPALALGIAQQLTNILRDVGEDRLRGRIYLPLEDLRRFNYTEEDLMNCVLDSRYKNLMKFEIARARRYYRQAQKGIALLGEDSQLAVQASLDMYSQILDQIEENGYDNFNRRAYVSKTKKLLTVPLSYMRTRQSQAWQPFLTAAESVMGVRRDV